MAPEAALPPRGPGLHQSQPSLAGTPPPPPSWIPGPRGAQSLTGSGGGRGRAGPNRWPGAAEGGASAAAPAHVAARPAFPPPAPAAPVELQLQRPDTARASRQGISVRLSVGTAAVGVAPAQRRASPAPSPGRRRPPEPGAGGAGCVGGSEGPGCRSLPELKCGVTGGPLPTKPEPHVLGSSFPLAPQTGRGD